MSENQQGLAGPGGSESAVAAFLQGGGEMGALMRAHDWRSTALGAPEAWPQALRTAIRLLLNTGHPMYIWWGPELLCFYNDAYRQSIGSERHPGSLGQPGRQVWEEIWPIIGPQIDQVMSGGAPTWHENALVPITRDGRCEDVYWTYSYGPIDDASAPNGVGGVLVLCTETTATVLAERRRAEELQRQRRLFEQAPGFIIVMRGPEHVIEFVNDGHKLVFGSDDWTGRTIRDAFVGIVDQEFFRHLDSVYASGTIYQAQEADVCFRRSPTAPEETRCLTFTYAPLTDEDGRINGIFCEGFEVTSRRLAMDALRESAEANAKFRTMFEQGMQFAGLLSLDGRLLEANHVAVEGCGFRRDDIIGRPFWDCGWWSPSPTLRETVKAACASAAAGVPFRSESSYFMADGTPRLLALIIAPVIGDNGEVLFLNPTGIDITERVNFAQELVVSRESSDRQQRLYEAILTNTPDLAYVFDLQHRFIYANDVLLKMWGKTESEAIGKTCLENGYEPWHAEMHDREIDQVIATRQPIRGEVPFNGTFGRRIYDYIFVPVLDEDGNVEAVAGTTRDVTDRQEIENKLRGLAAELSEVDRRKTEFLAMLAHELRNPLAPLRNAVQIIRSAEGNVEVVRSAAEIMQRQLGQMVRLVDDLIDISRISHGNIGLQRERLELSTVIQQAVETCRPMIDNAQQQLEIELPAGPLILDADAVRLAQVVSNLLNNASKYSPPGSRIRLRVRRNAAEVMVAVQDEGIGIAPEMLPGIFDMFTQLDRSSEHSRSGLGIGLALVRTLVEMHGGSVQGSSGGPGKGSEFIVRLPLLADDSALVDATASAPATISGRRILIVDDNQDSALSMSRILELMGNVTRTAYDGLEAVELAANFAPELVLLDIGLPGIDGYEVCRRVLRQSAKKPAMVAVTGWGHGDDRRQSAEAGFAAHLVKPVDYDTLARVIGELLSPQVTTVA